MARKKKSAKTTRTTGKSARSSHKMVASGVDFMPAPALSDATTSGLSPRGVNLRLAIGLIVLVLVTVLVTNKGLLVAAIVNGRPIFRWDLNKAMTAKFGQQTLESMISEQLIGEEAKKAGVVVSQADVDAKVKEITKSLGENVKIDDLLKYQGMTKGDFENQIRLQLTIEKVLGKDVKITDDDITNFIAANQETLTATDEAGLKEEARQSIMSQKISEKLQPWFAQIKEKAKIVKFLQ